MTKDIFTGRISEENKNLIIEFENSHPKTLATIAYGSLAIKQSHSNDKDNKQLDIINIVLDLKEWLLENMETHPEEFSKSTLKYYQKSSIEQLEKGAPIIYFSLDKFKNQYIKRGIISLNSFLSSCYKRTSLYVPFRLEKVIEIIKCSDEKIINAILYDRKITLILALLMLEKEEQNLYNLITKICSLSYIGDFRMLIHCEDPNKIKNIVDAQFATFVQDYELINNNYFKVLENNTISINYKQLKKELITLPTKIIELLQESTIDENNINHRKAILEKYFIEAGKQENLKQALKGIKTTGINKSLTYGVRKLKKGLVRTRKI